MSNCLPPYPPGTFGPDPSQCVEGAQGPIVGPGSGLKGRKTMAPVLSPTELFVAKPDQGTKKTKKRTVFSYDQLMSLHGCFRTHQYLTPHQIRDMSSSLDLQYGQVKTWFQNRRMKHKKLKQYPDPDDNWKIQVDSHPGSFYEMPPGLSTGYPIPVGGNRMLPMGVPQPDYTTQGNSCHVPAPLSGYDFPDMRNAMVPISKQRQNCASLVNPQHVNAPPPGYPTNPGINVMGHVGEPHQNVVYQRNPFPILPPVGSLGWCGLRIPSTPIKQELGTTIKQEVFLDCRADEAVRRERYTFAPPQHFTGLDGLVYSVDHPQDSPHQQER